MKPSTICAVVAFSVIFVLVILLIGNLPANTTTLAASNSVAETPAEEHLLAIVLDLSSSCHELMVEGGQGYAYVLKMIDQYFMKRIGSGDKLILAQVSGNNRPLLFEGTPLELRRRFPSAKAFREFLAKNSDPSASNVYAGVTRALDYSLTRMPARGNSSRSRFVVLSDLNDTSTDSKKSARTMLESVAAFEKAGGEIAFFFVDQNVAIHFEKHLKELGIQNVQIETEIVGAPLLPALD